MLGILFSVLVAVYAVYKIYNNPEYYITSTFYFSILLFAVLTASLFGLGLRRLPDELKVNMSVLFITVGISVYGFEIYLDFYSLDIQQSTQSRKAIQEQMGVPYDTRTKIEVIDDLIDSGINAYPNVGPDYLVKNASTKNGFISKGGEIFPLGGISNQMMVQKNENGYWMMYVGDRYGFHNPDNVYDVNTVDIVMTGDSFAEGWAVRSDENISAVLRSFDWNVVNLGKAGNGPLLEYAAQKEYAQILKPKIVLWLYWPNDIENDLVFELKSDLLRRYLNEDEFSQNLLSRQSEIDNSLIQFVEGSLVEQVVSQALIEERTRLSEQQLEIVHRKEFASKSMVKILKLRNLRKIVNLVPEPAAETNPELAEPALPGQSPGLARCD